MSGFTLETYIDKYDALTKGQAAVQPVAPTEVAFFKPAELRQLLLLNGLALQGKGKTAPTVAELLAQLAGSALTRPTQQPPPPWPSGADAAGALETTPPLRLTAADLAASGWAVASPGLEAALAQPAYLQLPPPPPTAAEPAPPAPPGAAPVPVTAAQPPPDAAALPPAQGSTLLPLMPAEPPPPQQQQQQPRPQSASSIARQMILQKQRAAAAQQAAALPAPLQAQAPPPAAGPALGPPASEQLLHDTQPTHHDTEAAGEDADSQDLVDTGVSAIEAIKRLVTGGGSPASRLHPSASASLAPLPSSSSGGHGAQAPASTPAAVEETHAAPSGASDPGGSALAADAAGAGATPAMHTPWLAAQVAQFAAAPDSAVSQEPVSGTAGEAAGQLGGRRVAFLLMEPLQIEGGAGGQQRTLATGIYSGRATRGLGSACDPGACSAGCRGGHVWFTVKVADPAAGTDGRKRLPIELEMDLSPHARCGSYNQLLALGPQQLQDAWLLLQQKVAPDLEALQRGGGGKRSRHR